MLRSVAIVKPFLHSSTALVRSCLSGELAVLDGKHRYSQVDRQRDDIIMGESVNRKNTLEVT